MACGETRSLREALSSTTNRLRFYSLIPPCQNLQPFHPVGECRRHIYSLFPLWGGLDCNRFGAKYLVVQVMPFLRYHPCHHRVQTRQKARTQTV
jgi:hypothetical protein